MEVSEALEQHRLWLERLNDRVDFKKVDLNKVNLSGANLRLADLSETDLSGIDLSESNLSGVNLRWANLSRADLSRADLSGAGLNEVVGNGKEIISLQTDSYHINYTSTHIYIGCKTHSIERWFNFSDKEILAMDGRKALAFWKKWKPILKLIMGVADTTKKNTRF